MSRADHRRRERPARASVFVDSAVRLALVSAEAPLRGAELHALVKGDCQSLAYLMECLAVLVERGKLLQIGEGEGATYWLRSRPIKVSRQSFTTKVMA